MKHAAFRAIRLLLALLLAAAWLCPATEARTYFSVPESILELRTGHDQQPQEEASLQPCRQLLLAAERATQPVAELAEPIDLLSGSARTLGQRLNAFVEAGQYFYLGANGALVAGTNRNDIEFGSLASVAAEVHKDRIALWTMWGYYLLATVDGAGHITLQETTHNLTAGKLPDGSQDAFTATVSRALLPDFPTVWPCRNANGDFAFPQPGAIMSRAREDKISVPTAPPECVGWLLQTMGDGLVAPMPDAQLCPDILWIMPAADQGFSLVHSGPRNHGLYATVTKSAQVLYGEEKAIFPMPNAFSRQMLHVGNFIPESLLERGYKSWWQAFASRDRSTITLLPPGAHVFPSMGETDRIFMVVKDGKFLNREVIMRPIL